MVWCRTLPNNPYGNRIAIFITYPPYVPYVMEVTTETVPMDAEPPADSENPLARVESGDVDTPDVGGWDFHGTAYCVEDNIHEMSWAAEMAVPGYPESEKVTLVLEHTDFIPDEPFNTGFNVALFPFNADGEPLNPESFIQESINVGTYKRLSVALGNVENVLERMANMENGDAIILNEKKYVLEGSEMETETETESESESESKERVRMRD